MATYVNDLRLKEIATGDEAGTWGTSTNTNLELIGEALGYGTQNCFSSDADATTTIADGASDPARAMYFRITSSATLSAGRTLTIAPNTISRVMFIENATTGSQVVTISQGTGGNVAIANGKTAVVYLDGAGSGAAVVDAMALVDPGITDTLAEVLVAGNASSGTNVELTTTDKVQFRDTAIYLNSSADGQLDIVADTEVQIAATTIDINGNVDISGTAGIGGVLTANAGVVVDNITIDGQEIDVSSGDLTLDVAGDIILDADGGQVIFKDGGTQSGFIDSAAGNFILKSTTSDADIKFQGNDGGSAITALTLDMSAAGAATFNSDVGIGATPNTYSGYTTLTLGSSSNGGIIDFERNGTIKGEIFTEAAIFGFQTIQADDDIIFKGNDGGSTITALTLDMSAAGEATFNDDINLGDSKRLRMGAGGDFEIFHDGSNNYIKGASSDQDIIFQGVDGGSAITALTLDMSAAGAATFTGAITANAGVVVDNITIDGQEIDVSSGNLTLDVAGETVIDSGSSGILRLKVSGTDYGMFFHDNTHMYVQSNISDGDMVFRGNDGGSTITALTLDMSNAGAATFNAGATFASSVGIGTSSPNTTLHLSGLTGSPPKLTLEEGGAESRIYVTKNSPTNSDLRFQTEISGTIADRMIIDYSGAATFNAGVTATGLEVEAATPVIEIDSTTSANLATLQFTTSGTVDSKITHQASTGTMTIDSGRNASWGGEIDFVTDTATRFRIAADGSLSTPTSGTSNVRFGVNAGNSIASGGNQNTVIGDEAGTAITTGDENVFVGFQSGDALVDGTFNVAIGSNSLTTDTKGKKSVAIGTNALATQNFTSLTDTFNTAVGHSAGTLVTTGVQNTLIGGLAGDALTSSSDNTAVGYQALGSATTGNENTAVGHSALFTNILSDRNVALGLDALRNHNQASSIDSYNTAVGYNTGAAVTTGVSNTLIGGLAGDALTDADYNVAVGFSALSTSVLGSRSTAIGHEALKFENPDSATDMYNTAVGFNAGNVITTGTNNTLIGGLSGDAITTGTKNIAIGYRALSDDTQGSKNVAVGNFSLATQNFTSATDSYNTGVGHGAGEAVTTGVRNTLMGGLVGDALTDADYNTAIGYQSLTTDTLGSKSTAVGYATLANQNFTSATDSFNTAYGFNAGNQVTTGVSNTLIGGLAGDALTDADNTTAIGYQALTANTTGGNNTAVGKDAGLTVTTGANNTYIGFGAGPNSSTGTGNQNTTLGFLSGNAITSGAKNTIIGAYTGNGGGLDIRTASNNIVLSDGDGNVRQYMTSNGFVLIGTYDEVIYNHGAGGDDGVSIGPNSLQIARSGDQMLLLNRMDTQGPVAGFYYEGAGVGSISVTTSATAYNTSSDHRLKENVVYDWDATTRLKQLKPARFNFIADADTTVDGFLAHEAQAVVPEAVTGTHNEVDDDGVAVMQGIDQSKLVPLLVKAIQEQQALIDALTARIETLEG